MGMVTKIKMLLVKKGMTQKEVAEKLGVTQGNLSRKFSSDNLSERDIEKIAGILNCEFRGTFIDRDTNEIL